MAKRLSYIRIDVEGLENTIIDFDNNISVKDQLKKENIKKFYQSEYPTDDMGEELNSNVSFFDLWDGMLKKQDYHKIIDVCDSVVRERLFTRLSKIIGVDYMVIYSLWLNK